MMFDMTLPMSGLDHVAVVDNLIWFSFSVGVQGSPVHFSLVWFFVLKRKSHTQHMPKTITQRTKAALRSTCVHTQRIRTGDYIEKGKMKKIKRKGKEVNELYVLFVVILFAFALFFICIECSVSLSL